MSEFRTTDYAPTACPHCTYIVEAATSAMKDDPKALATPGGISVCIRCGGVSEFTDKMTLIPFDVNLLDSTAAATVKLIQSFIAASGSQD